MSALATTDRLIERSPDIAAAAIRALVATQRALKADPARATEIGRKLFPPAEAGLIAELIRRDLPYYDPRITRGFVDDMNQFARDLGRLQGNPAYETIVATRFAPLWDASA
jgi:ABC-type nitrate/sulfonate/bicarbonate transport system substrate-binding protein